MMDIQATGEAFSPQNRISKHEIFVGHFCPPETGSNLINPVNIRYRISSAIFRKIMNKCEEKQCNTVGTFLRSYLSEIVFPYECFS
jgi:hypothetical protein